MNRLELSAFAMLLAGCPVARAYDVPEPDKCVIDQCTGNTCTVETPEGWVDIPKKENYEEGMRIKCPLHLIEPT